MIDLHRSCSPFVRLRLGPRPGSIVCRHERARAATAARDTLFRLDANLLVALDALLRERNVTRAARQLGMASQACRTRRPAARPFR